VNPFKLKAIEEMCELISIEKPRTNKSDDVLMYLTVVKQMGRYFSTYVLMLTKLFVGH
jgi:hypothetical protein